MHPRVDKLSEFFVRSHILSTLLPDSCMQIVKHLTQRLSKCNTHALQNVHTFMLLTQKRSVSSLKVHTLSVGGKKFQSHVKYCVHRRLRVNVQRKKIWSTVYLLRCNSRCGLSTQILVTKVCYYSTTHKCTRNSIWFRFCLQNLAVRWNNSDILRV